MPLTARQAAYEALSSYRKRGARPEMIISIASSRENMDRRDTALALNITGGVLQNEALCDYYISAFSDTEIKKLDPAVLDILRLSVYQILFLERVPVHAAVSEGVELAKQHAKRASGMVNAILRRVAENRNHMPEIKAEDEPSRLAILYSHPKWLVQELISMYGAADAEEILKADNTPAPVTLMVNTLKCSMQEAEKLLLGDGASVTEHPYLDDAFFVSGAGSIEKLTAFKNGCVYVQDAAARMAAVAASPKPGQTVIDVCAAPGGKSAACAVMMKNEGRIISCDIHEKKLGQITELAGRMGIRIIETAAGDGRVFNEKLAGLADVVITDVPCSGLGVIRKKPEIRYKAKEELSRLPEIQYGILENASKYVKPDGVLLYSTCTIMKSENESVVERFLAEHPEFEKESFTLPGPFGDIDGMTTLLPQQGGTDGFFICRMRRKN